MIRSTIFPENQLCTRVVDIVDKGSKIESWVGVGVLVRSGRKGRYGRYGRYGR